MPNLALKQIVKSFDGNEVIPNLDLEIPGGGLTVFLGPSGCGKSTLLRLIAGLEYPDSGAIWLAGREITRIEPRDRNVAMVFQNYALYPHLTVRENLSFPLKIAKIPKQEISARVEEAAALLGLTPLLERLPRTLSGGERQRTAVGRAIVRDPEVFLFDEPLSNLDFQLRNQMRGEIKALQRRLGKTMIYVTHDQTEAMTMADHLVVLRKGKIMQRGTPTEIYNEPAHAFVAGFIGSPPMNFLRVRARNGELATLQSRVIIGQSSIADGEYLLGVRPDHIYAGEVDGEVRMNVDQREFHGAATYLHGTLDGEPLLARLSDRADSFDSEATRIDFSRAALHLFDLHSEARVS